MFRKVVASVALGLLVLGSFGCGSGGTEIKGTEAAQGYPGLEAAKAKQAAGQPLTGKEKRILEDAEMHEQQQQK